MKTAIKLVLIYLGCQILAALLVMIPSVMISLIKEGKAESTGSLTLALSMFVGFLLMAFYLYKAGYISRSKVTWSPVSVSYLFYSVIIVVASIIVIDFLMSAMPSLPNWLEDSFNLLQSGWFGIVCIAILGPILEELLFRGGITKVLLKKYTPTKAIILSALIFGIFHLNPVQMVGAGLMGLLLAWVYYKTASLIPCILMHIVNNSLSVYLSFKYPDVDYIRDIVGDNYSIVVAVAVVLFVITYLVMRKTSVANDWKKEENADNN
jgi:uncharacterized protein